MRKREEENDAWVYCRLAAAGSEQAFRVRSVLEWVSILDPVLAIGHEIATKCNTKALIRAI